MNRPAPPVEATVLIGSASFYDEFGVTASGEPYDPKAFTAAVKLDLRDRFGGVKSAPHYRPAYVIAEFGGKRAVLKINNVGTMKAGRLFDLSRAAMEYFGGIDKGLISGLKVTILPLGRDYKLGPLSGEVEEIVLTNAAPAKPPTSAPPPAVVVTPITPDAAAAALRSLAADKNLTPAAAVIDAASGCRADCPR